MAAKSGLELRSKITHDGTLELWLEEVTTPAPAADEVLLRVEATPINPSDLAMLLGPVDMATLRSGGTPDRPVTTATVPQSRLPAVAARLDQPLLVGNEGAGIVIDAGYEARELEDDFLLAFEAFTRLWRCIL